MRFLPPKICGIATALIFGASASSAQDGKLYPDVADPDASFVRVVALDTPVAVVGEKSFTNPENGVTPFVIVDAGEVPVTSGEVKASIEVSKASYYTVVIADDGTSVTVEDKITNSPAQADLAFYNLSDKPLVDLYVPRASASALEDIAKDGAGSVALKAPLTLNFEVREGETALVEIPPVELKRRGGVTIVFTGSDGAYTAAAIENRFVN